VRHVAIEEPYAPRRRVRDAGEQIYESRLSRAVWTDDDDEFALLDLE